MIRDSALWRLARPLDTIPIWTGALAGAFLARPSTGPLLAAGVAAALALAGCAGSALDDACDAAVDSILRPGRPIPAGLVSREAALAWGVAALAASVIALAAADLRCAGAALALAGLIVVCASTPQDRACLPVLQGACRGLVYAAAALAVSGGLTRSCLLGAAALALYAAGVSAVKAGRGEGERAARVAPLLLFPFGVAAPAMAATDARACLWLAGLAWVTLCCLRLVRGEGSRAASGLFAALPVIDALMLARSVESPVVWLAAAGLPASLALRRLLPD